uniref:Polyamine aminopropyltransferase n=1 Tax=Schlesneria paludicola TaxID=360056 RepID=A0A7C4LTA8_9PLAN
MHRAPLFLLYLNVLVIATCGLIYELLAGTLASYVLGDSVTQFSLVIGVYLSALGAGAWLSGFVRDNLARTFIEVELGVALLGGSSAALLFLTFAHVRYFAVVLYLVVFAIGVLVGLELPLLMRILKEHLDFSALVARVLTFDYIGALAASVLFPLLFVPRLGLVRTALLFGLLNALVGLWGTWLLRPLLSRRGLGALRGRAVLVAGLLLAGLIKADALTRLAEENLFPQPIVYAQSSPYQRIVVTQGPDSFQLYLNGNMQFNSADEYRYHEALVHPAVLLCPAPRQALVLGGGDGLAVRELLKHDAVERITLVDIDPAMTALADVLPPLAELTGAALRHPKVRLVHRDALLWLEETQERFDVCVIDFPDPGTFSLGKLYTTRFYRLLRARLADHATVGIQCTSPIIARSSYWCILRTLEAAGFYVRPYHVAVPSFGDWGFALAAPRPLEHLPGIPVALQPRLKFLNNAALTAMFDWPEDMAPVPVEINRLDNQALVRYYEAEWSRWQ